MARIARDSTPQRRSTRLSNNQSTSVNRVPSSSVQLDAVLERDEPSDNEELLPVTSAISTPGNRRDIEKRLKELSQVTTPKTEPKPASGQMHPATIHQTTAKAPDSGLKLGFADISTTGRASIASLQNTPSRPRQSLARTNISPSFQFKFSHEANLSNEGRQLMESIRVDAAKIKEKMRAEKELQEKKDAEAEGMMGASSGRQMAKPTGRAGRFSDVHMAQFKKMDSIANHASAFRAKPAFSKPTAQSLKRSSSKANLDEPERPKTAGKSPSTRIPPPITGRFASLSPFKSIPPNSLETKISPVKRLRREDDKDVSTSKTTTLPRPISSRLLSPTKASAARTIDGTATPGKSPAPTRTNSIRSIRSQSRTSTVASGSPVRPSQTQISKPLPPIPHPEPKFPTKQPLTNLTSIKSKATASQDDLPPPSASKIPTIAGLKSILRSPRKTPSQPYAGTPKHSTTVVMPRSSQKKVDFTPSVKSRYAVKLAEASPSPAKLDRSRVADEWEPAIPYDSSAFVISNENEWDEDDEEEVDAVYPTLPTLSPRPMSRAGPVDRTIQSFMAKAKEYGRRESTEFKSIFTTLHPRPDPDAVPTTLTKINTGLNRSNPNSTAARVSTSPPKPRTGQSPSTIRQVRNSVQILPFEDRVKTVPHGLPGKKRRLESSAENERYGQDDDAKENRLIAVHYDSIPGAWGDSTHEKDAEEQDEGAKRGWKRARFTRSEEPEHIEVEKQRSVSGSVSPMKKKASAARELAAKTAKERKIKANAVGSNTAGDSKGSGGGIRGMLSASRLNALALPKRRG